MSKNNDFSHLQTHLLQHGLITRQYWIVSPDHISYFNKKGLTALCEEAGWTVRDVIADYPIDFHLFNRLTNYVEDRASGKACHEARVRTENFLHALSPENTNQLYRALADLGLGRQIIGFFQPL